MDTAQPQDLSVTPGVGDHSRGHPHAAVVLVEYGDFECPHCSNAAPALRLMLKRYPVGLRLVFRHFPLEEVHPHALEAALAAESAAAQRTFWPMHDLLFRNGNHLKSKQLRRYASELELDMPRYDAEMADTVHLQRVREHIESGRRSGVRSTPTFFINGTLVDASFGLEALHDRVEAEMRSCAGIVLP